MQTTLSISFYVFSIFFVLYYREFGLFRVYNNGPNVVISSSLRLGRFFGHFFRDIWSNFDGNCTSLFAPGEDLLCRFKSFSNFYIMFSKIKSCVVTE
jgi:hypothetical protein